METSPTFVQVVVPAESLAVGRATLARRVRVDGIAENGVRRDGRRVIRILAIVRGLSPPGLSELTEDLASRYGRPVQLVHQDADEGAILYELEPHVIGDPVLGVLLAFQSIFGPPWLHLAHGQMTLRAEGQDCAPKDCAARLRHALRLAEVPRDVRVVHPGRRDLERWRAVQQLRQRLRDDDLLDAGPA